MALSLRVPALGESVREATLGTWKRAEGDHVEADEPLVEVESEKATLEVPSPGAGVLRKILRKAGETVAVGEVIPEIGPGPAASAGAASDARSGNGQGAAATELRAAPSARRAMAESGISPAEVKGSGRGGRISKQDVVRALGDREPALEVVAREAVPEPIPERPAEKSAGVAIGTATDAGRERVVPMS